MRRYGRVALLSFFALLMAFAFQNCGRVGSQDNASKLPGDIVIESALKSCLTPWGQSIAHGASVKAFALNNSQCQEEERICSDGQLSGTFSGDSCLGAQTISCGETSHPNISSYKSCGGLIEGTVLGLTGEGIPGQFAYGGSIVMTQKYNCSTEKYDAAFESSNSCCTPKGAFIGGQENSRHEWFNVSFNSCHEAMAATDNLKISTTEVGPLSRFAQNCCSGKARIMKVVGESMADCDAKSQAVVLCE